jgi:hypothetical protein
MSVNSSTITRSDAADGTDPLADAGRQAGQSGEHLVERAADIGFRQADRGKEQAADGLSQVADSIRRVSADMEGTQPQIASVAETAAEQAERVAAYLKQTDAREMLDTVENIARRQPLLFLGGAFLLGMAATRLIKAAGGGNANSGWNSYGQDWRTTRSYGADGGYGSGYGAQSRTGSGRSSLGELSDEGI